MRTSDQQTKISTKNAKKENEILIRNEKLINGKYIQSQNMLNSNTSTLNDSNMDTTQYSTFISNNNKKNYNNITSNLNNSNNDLNYDNFSQKKNKHKNQASHNALNKNNININQNYNSLTPITSANNNINQNINPSFIQSSNMNSMKTITFNIPLSNLNHICANNQINNPSLLNSLYPLSNTSFVSPNNAVIKNENENNSQNLDVEQETDEESDEGRGDDYILELICLRRFGELSDKDLLSNLLIIAKEQSGCRFLQQKMEDNPNFANFEMYPEIHEYFGELICDPFGNYLVQKMLECLTSEKINHLIKDVKYLLFILFFFLI